MGKISRIQLRGISRTPSDRLTQDGGCAESLNVYLEEDETAPVLKPEDITEELNISAMGAVERVFIHKTASTEIYILISPQDVGYYTEEGYVSIFNMNAEVFVDVTSIGNTLIVATESNIHYAIFVNGAYKYLGTRIPEPHIEFRSIADNDYASASRISLFSGSDTSLVNSIDLLDVSAWELAIDKIDRDLDDTTGVKERLLELQEEIWHEVNKRIKANKDAKVFTAPLFIRYAVRLYDGSYIYQSVPILLGAGADKFIEVTGYRVASSSEVATYLTIKPSIAFKSTAHLVRWDTDGWEDLIESLDIFVSTDIYHPAINSNVASIVMTADGSDIVDTDVFSIAFNNGGLSDIEGMEKELLSKGNFYKIASFRASDTSKLTKGYDLFDGDYPSSMDSLVENDRLPDYEQSGSMVIPSRIYSYNNRVLASGGTRLLPTGYMFLQSTNIVTQGQNALNQALSFIIAGAGGTSHKVLARASDGGYIMTPYGIDTSDEGGSSMSYASSYGLIMFPDPRCIKVEIWDAGGDVCRIEMKPHPLLNCSYAYWGLSKTINDYDGNVQGDVTIGEFTADENRQEDDSQRIYLSEANNPFYFPLQGNSSLPAKVLGIATVSTALSQGQFGQFPLYVFTEDGIWVMETAADGSFVSSKPLSREVCINPDSITPIDQAVLFMTNKGLMHIQGSQITNLSPYMNGRHPAFSESAKTIIEGQSEFCDLMPVLTDDTPFMAFMKNATLGYDYAGKRILCINEDVLYQYVYKLDTQTWHKIYHPQFGKFIKAINSYPRCEVMAFEGLTLKIIDLSTSLDGTKSQLPERGVIATRTLDLGEPDVFKTVTDVRTRGQFAKGAVKFILQGSQDGINFYTISTLRGKAWKLFRIILLADLDIYERISWIDVQYDTKFTNRLR